MLPTLFSSCHQMQITRLHFSTCIHALISCHLVFAVCTPQIHREAASRDQRDGRFSLLTLKLSNPSDPIINTFTGSPRYSWLPPLFLYLSCEGHRSRRLHLVLCYLVSQGLSMKQVAGFPSFKLMGSMEKVLSTNR